MDFTFRELRQKEVVDLETGERLGRTCDLAFSFDTGCVLGISVPERGAFCKSERFIPLCDIQKIGEDVVLIRSKPQPPPCKKGKPPPSPYDEEE